MHTARWRCTRPRRGSASIRSPPADERRILYEIIRTVSSTVDLEQVLEAVVKLIVEGVKAQSCFVWIVERGGRLVLRAASEQYADAVGVTTLAPGEGFAGWVSEHRQPIFIPSDALADPRARYFPEFEEEKYQSMVSVPLIAKDGALFGVIGLHSLAPRTLTEDDAYVRDPLGVAGGRRDRERAAVRGDAAPGARAGAPVGDLRPCGPRDRARRAAARRRRGGLRPARRRPGVRLRRRPRRAPRAPRGGARGRRGAAVPRRRRGRASCRRAVARGAEPAGAVRCRWPSTARSSGHVVALRASFAFDAGELDLLGTVAAQTAVGWKKIELIDGLTERNLTKDFFGDLAGGRLEGAEGRARRLGCDLSSPRLAVVVLPHDPASRSGRRARRGARAVRGGGRPRAGRRACSTAATIAAAGSCRSSAPTASASVERLRAALGSRCRWWSASRTPPPAPRAWPRRCRRPARRPARRRSCTERPGVVTFDGLGPYKYLLRVQSEEGERDRHREALRRLVDYDRQRRAELCRTLEEYLAGAATSPPPRRRCTCTRTRCASACAGSRRSPGLDVREGEWLMIEIALKLLRLEELVD